MLEYLKLQDVGPSSELQLRFAPRLNLITGDNGLGKSFLLNIAWWALTRTWAGYPARPHRGKNVKPEIRFRFQNGTRSGEYTSSFDWDQQAWTGRVGRPVNPCLVLYAQVDGGFSVWDPARNYWRTNGDVDVQERPSAYHFKPEEVWDGLERDDKILCNGLIRDWAVWQLREGEAFEQLVRVLHALSSPGEQLDPGDLTRISLDDVRDIPTLKTPYGSDVPVVHAAAGIKRIVALAYLLVWAWQEHIQASLLLNRDTARKIIFFVDEIEAHLHPRWQRVILRALLDVMKAFRETADVEVQILTATHSPLLLASVEPFFDARQDALWSFQLAGDGVDFQQEPWRPRGDANSWLTSNIFDLAEPRSLEAEVAITRAMKLAKEPVPDPGSVREADKSLRSILKDVDPFWVRWRWFVEQLEARE